MTQVLHAELAPTNRRVGIVVINHEGLTVCCEICVYKYEKLWIRMPEFWVNPTTKKRLVYWDSQQLSDEKQVFILKKVFDMLEWDLDTAVKIKRDFFNQRKELTKQENKLTLNQKSSEE